MKHVWMCALATSLLAAVGGTLRADDTEAAEPAKWVPIDALAYLGITDINKTWKQFQSTADYKMMKDPAAKEALGEFSFFLKFTEKARERVAAALELEPEQLKSPFGGALAVYIALPHGGAAEDAYPVLIAGVGNKELMRAYYGKARGKLRKLADEYESVSFGALTIDRFTNEPAKQDDEDEELDEFLDANDVFGMDEDPMARFLEDALDEVFSTEALPDELAMCLTDDRLIVAATPDDIKAILRRTRNGESLADAEDYKELARRFKSAGPVRFLVNLPRVFELLRAESDEEQRKTLAALGTKSVRSLIGHVRYAGERYDSLVEMMLLMSGERTGLARILSMENRAITPPASVPADAVMFASLNLDPKKLMNEIERMMRRADPDAADAMRETLEEHETAAGEKLHLRKDLIENLRGPLIWTMRFTRPLAPESPQVLLTIGQRDRDALARLIESVPFLLARDVQGTPVFDAPMFGLSLATTSNAVLAGNTQAVETAIQPATAASGLAGNANFQRAARLVADDAWATVYVDSRRLMEVGLEFVAKRDELTAQAMMNPATLIAAGLLGKMFQSLDKDDVEPARKLLDYQSQQIFTIRTTPDGLRATAVELKPKTE